MTDPSRAVRRTICAATITAAACALLAAPPAGAQPPVPPGGHYYAVTPARALSAGATAAASTTAVTVLNHFGVPAGGVSAVSVRVTVVGGGSPGFVTAWPAGATRPTASTLNFAAGQTISNAALVPVGSGGRIDLFTNAPLNRLIADVVGYTDDLGGDARGAFGTLSPARLLDTRTGSGPLAPGATLHVPVVGHGGVPSVNNGFGYAAAVLNVAAVAPSASGYVTVWADGTARPATSNLDVAAGLTRANLVVAGIGSGGGVDVYNGTSQPIQLIADVSGYISGGAPNSDNQFALVGPTRLLDTRSGGSALPVPAFGTVQVTAGTYLPASAAAVNLTVVTPGSSGYLVAWPDGAARPGTSALNFDAGTNASGLNVVPTTAAGKFDIYNASPASIELVVDEFGIVT